MMGGRTTGTAELHAAWLCCEVSLRFASEVSALWNQEAKEWQ